MEDLTDDQKFANYCRLVETIEYIESGGRITEDWMECQKTHIHTIASFFTEGFQNLNPEIKTQEFRKIAKEVDVIMNNLLSSIHYEKTFKVGHYNILLNKILIMFKLSHEFHEKEDELSEFMNNMSLG
jgi:hypothetical protein